MIKTRKHNYGPGSVKKKFDLSSKERSRASEDGVAIIVRQQQSGTYGVFAVDINSGLPIGDNWYEVDTQSEIPKAITSLNRDLDKFYDRGGKMSGKGRMRLKEGTMNPRKAFEKVLEKQADEKGTLRNLFKMKEYIAFEQAIKKQAGHFSNLPLLWKIIQDANVSSLWRVIMDVSRVWKGGNEQGAAETLYRLDERIADLQLELKKLSEASQAERKKFYYVSSL